MKKRVFSWVLALVMLLALSVPALAAAEPEPEYRLASVTASTSIGSFAYTFTYGQGGYLPTEVLCNGSTYSTASYDEAGQITAFQDEFDSDSFVYDEAGNCIRRESTYEVYDGQITSVTEYTYDEAGNRARSEDISTDSVGSEAKAVTEYTYDEAGNCVREEYTTTGRGDSGGYTRVIEYTYDEENRMVSKEETVDGEERGKTAYAYDEDSYTTTNDNGTTTCYEAPLVQIAWEKLIYNLEDGTSLETSSCRLVLKDDAGRETLFWGECDCDSEPTLTYDDNGYLVRVDGAAGNYIELTYEPVA